MPDALNANGKASKGDKEVLMDEGEAFDSDAKAVKGDRHALKRESVQGLWIGVKRKWGGA